MIAPWMAGGTDRYEGLKSPWWVAEHKIHRNQEDLSPRP